MEKYQFKIRSSESYLYGGQDVRSAALSAGLAMVIRNDESGERFSLKVVRKVPTQQEETIDCGVVGAAQVFSIDLQHVLRVVARCLDANVDTLATCTIMSMR